MSQSAVCARPLPLLPETSSISGMSKRPGQAQPDTNGLSADHPERIASGTDGAPQWCRVVQKSAPAYLQDAGPASRVYMRPALDCRHVLARIWMAAGPHGSPRPGHDLNRNRRSGRAVCAQRSLQAHRGWLGQLTQADSACCHAVAVEIVHPSSEEKMMPDRASI